MLMVNKVTLGIILLLISIYFFSVHYHKRTNDMKKSINYYENQVLFLENEIETIKQHFKLNLNTFDGKSLSGLNLINENGDSITLKNEISGMRYNLVVLFSKETCYDCLEKQLPIISNNDFSKIFITDYRSINELRIIKKKYNIVDEFNRLNDHVDIERFLVYKESPIIFVVDEDLNILSSFITHKHLTDYTELYLNHILSNL